MVSRFPNVESQRYDIFGGRRIWNIVLLRAATAAFLNSCGSQSRVGLG